MSEQPNQWPVAPDDRATLLTWSRSTSVRAGHALRARIVLGAADGEGTAQLAARLGVSRPTVIKWRARYARSGLAGLGDEPRPGRPRIISPREVLVATLAPPPAGVDRWSTRSLAAELAIGDATVARAWRHYGIQPLAGRALSLAAAPPLVGTVTELLGVYLDSTTAAIAVRVEPLVDAIAAPPRSLPHRGGPPPPTARRAALRRAGQLGRGLERQGLLGLLARIGDVPDAHLILAGAPGAEAPGVRTWLDAHGWSAPHHPLAAERWPRLAEVLLAITMGPDAGLDAHQGRAAMAAVLATPESQRLPFVWLAQ